VIGSRSVVAVDERVDNRSEVREFLTSRRARVTPEQVGLPTFGGGRRVKGLRRGEVAQLAGVSVEYYTRLERGNLQGASESVLDAVARALLLDEAERTHLFDLARAATTRMRRHPAPQRVRPGIVRVVDAMTAPAWVRNGRSDFLASNRLARALYAPVFSQDHGNHGPSRPPNTARFAFLDPRARDFYVDWQRTANDIVAVLRAEAGRHPYDRGLTDLVGELSTRSDDFRTRWAAHDVQFHRTGFKRLRHPVVGNLDLTYEAMEFPSDPGLTLLVYTAEPSSPTADALALLASWAATVDREERADHEQQADAAAPEGT
jgi:transcriptional regulator with XRE-family HTH domain